MSQTTCDCNCVAPTLTMLPVHGFGLAVDTSKLPSGTGGLNKEEIQQMITDALKGTPPLTVPDTLYIAVTGNDNNDGLTPQTAFATVQAAIDSTAKYPQLGTPITISVGEGSFSGNVLVETCYNRLVLKGAGVDTTTIAGGINVTGSKHIDIADCRISNDSEALIARRSAYVSLSRCTLESSKQEIIAIVRCFSAKINMLGDIVIKTNSSAAYIMQVATNGAIQVSNKLSLFGDVTHAAVHSSASSNVYFTGANSLVSGSVTGRRYRVTCGGSITVLNGNTTFIPGTQAGLVETGGVYASM